MEERDREFVTHVRDHHVPDGELHVAVYGIDVPVVTLEPLWPVYASIETMQEKWTLHIIRALLEGPRGFDELGPPSAPIRRR